MSDWDVPTEGLEDKLDKRTQALFIPKTEATINNSELLIRDILPEMIRSSESASLAFLIWLSQCLMRLSAWEPHSSRKEESTGFRTWLIVRETPSWSGWASTGSFKLTREGLCFSTGTSFFGCFFLWDFSSWTFFPGFPKLRISGLASPRTTCPRRVGWPCPPQSAWHSRMSWVR